MTKQVQRRRGTASQHTSFTGADGEISVNTTNKSVHVHDGVTTGGIEAARADLGNVSSASVLGAAGITATAAELNYTDGVTSSIQTQLNTKAPINNATFTGTTVVPTADINGGTIDGTVIGGSTPATGAFTTLVATTVNGRDVAVDGSKLDGIEAGADITDTANVTAAGALMDSELTNIAAVKALNQGVATTNSPSFAGITATTADINGGTIDGTVIGGVEPAAGTFTALTSNGIDDNATSTAMTLDASGRLGIGATSPAYLLDVRSGATATAAHFFSTNTTAYAPTAYNGASARLLLQGGGATSAFTGTQFTHGGSCEAFFGVVQNSLGAADFVFQGYNGSAYAERMRIDSSGRVGIGTSNPYGDLHLQGAQQDVILTNSSADGVAGATIGRFISQARGYGNDGAELASIDFETNASNWFKGDIVFKTNDSDGTNPAIDATERLRIDASGHVGIGVTPSAWSSSGTWFRALDIQNGGALASFQNGISTQLLTNAFFNGSSFRYKLNGASGRYVNNGNSHIWEIAPSGTAGDAVTFTQAMTLDASGSLLLGTTSAGGYSGLIMGSGKTIVSPAVYANTSGGAANVGIASDGAFYRSTSSLRYKNSVQDATHGLAELLTLRPVTYKGNNDGDKVFGGLIAEEVHEAGLTEFVEYAEDGSPDALAYGNMVSLCIKAIQDQQAIIAALEARITALEA